MSRICIVAVTSSDLQQVYACTSSRYHVSVLGMCILFPDLPMCNDVYLLHVKAGIQTLNCSLFVQPIVMQYVQTEIENDNISAR